MNRIKVVGGLVFILSVMLALLAGYIANHNKEQSSILTFISEQKAFTQEISKSIFYSYRNNKRFSIELDDMVKKYLENAKNNESEFTQNHSITILWNIFYADVQKFRSQQKVSTGYNSVITAKLVNRIYHNNVLLINQFNKLIEQRRAEYHHHMDIYKRIEYFLFFILIALLIYLLTQVHVVMEFIQKFSRTSKKILENSTIEGIKPIEVEGAQSLLHEVQKNYNLLVNKIDTSIKYAEKSIEQTTSSLEEVTLNIEDLMELISTMQEHESEKIFEKEDAVIDSLETLMRLQKKLQDLKDELHNLT